MTLSTLEVGHEARVPEAPGVFSEGSELLGAVYEELRRSARRLMRRRAWGEHTLEPTGLVNEAVVRLLQDSRIRGHSDHRYVFAAALRTMDRILIESARARKRLKRGGETWKRVPLDESIGHFEEQNADVLDLLDAIERLARWDSRQAEIVTMRFFRGMKVVEIAEHHGLSVSTVESDLASARVWLRRALTRS